MKLQKLIMVHISMAGAEPFLITFSMIRLSLANAIRVKWRKGSGLKGGDL